MTRRLWPGRSDSSEPGCVGGCYIRIMENKMETTIVYWGYIGIMEKKMETTIVYCGYIRIMAK